MFGLKTQGQDGIPVKVFEVQRLNIQLAHLLAVELGKFVSEPPFPYRAVLRMKPMSKMPSP